MWQYKSLSGDSITSMIENANVLGKEGWELVTAFATGLH